MKISCNIIKDLLPLYAEKMVSADSASMIEEHVKECDSCRGALTALGVEVVISPQTDTAVLAHLGKQIRRRRIHTMILAVLVTASVLFGIFQYLYSPVYLSVQDAVADVTKKGDIVTLELSSRAGYCRWEDFVDPDTGRKSVTFIAARHRWDVLLEEVFDMKTNSDNGRLVQLGAHQDIWYASTSSAEEDTLLWGQEPSGGRISLPRLVLGYYFMMALGAGLVLLIPAVVLWRKKAGKIMSIVCTLCFSFVLSDLIATGGNWRIYSSHDLPILLTLMVIQTLLMTAAVLLGFHVRRTNRE